MKSFRLFFFTAMLVFASIVNASTSRSPDVLFYDLLGASQSERKDLFEKLDKQWQPYFTAIGLDILGVYYLSANGNFRREMVSFLEKNTQQNFGDDVTAWYQWLWQQNIPLPLEYSRFKSTFYRLLDPRFADYFDDEPNARIRLDEVRWGGVRQDGIPPLRQPEMIAAKEATYLGENDVIFGIVINGDARAYPKRILAWHEMFTDTIGGVPIAGVYCTLCGSVIPYETHHNNTQYQLGTSGFLYRSNKLMYDKTTQSLWSTMRGTPVMGPLVNQNIRLKRRSVITTTWKDWKKHYPASTVLSLNTGHSRNYDEGEAYRKYFATDKLMFDVSLKDDRLKNKAEVLALRTQDSQYPMAIDVNFLQKNPLFHTILGKKPIVVLTRNDGSIRVYESDATLFKQYQFATLVDKQGKTWEQHEAYLSWNDQQLKRIPAHRAFWFGWYAAFPNTQLIQ